MSADLDLVQSKIPDLSVSELLTLQAQINTYLRLKTELKVAHPTS